MEAGTVKIGSKRPEKFQINGKMKPTSFVPTNLAMRLYLYKALDSTKFAMVETIRLSGC